MISNFSDINIIHGDIHSQLCKKFGFISKYYHIFAHAHICDLLIDFKWYHISFPDGLNDSYHNSHLYIYICNTSVFDAHITCRN